MEYEGPLDLLGIDQDGDLIVFELKRGTLTREAVAQIIDYASYLDSLKRETLFKHIADRSGNGGIDKIEDFESWYQEQFSGNLDALDNPTKMVLVGLGVDDRTKRMVTYLFNNGTEILLLIFYAFQKGEQMFLAKQVKVKLPEKETGQKQSYNCRTKVIQGGNSYSLFSECGYDLQFDKEEAYEFTMAVVLKEIELTKITSFLRVEHTRELDR